MSGCSSRSTTRRPGARRHDPIVLTPDGTRLAVCDDITETVLFDVTSGDRVPAASAGKAVAMRWNPAGTTCAAVALTRLAGLFDAGGEHVAHLPAAEEGGYYLIGGGWTP